MANDVTIHFGADTSDLESGIEDVQSALTGLSPELTRLADGIGEAAKKSGPASGEFAQMARALGDGLVNALKPAASGFSQLGDAAGGAADAAKARIEGEIKAQQQALAIKRTIYDGEAALKHISEDEKLRLVIAATQQEYEAQRALLQKEEQLNDQSVRQKQQAQNKIAALDAAHQRQMLGLAYQAAEEQNKIWQDLSGRISQTLSSTISGLLQHTTTFREATRQVALQVVKYFVDIGAQWIASFATTIAKNVATHVIGEQAMTAATQAGVAERSAAAAAGAVADIAAKAAAVIKSILASSAEAFAGVFGFLAPLLGPAAAGPAAAAQATVAGVASIASFDIGAWSIPHDQLALVHKNELVMTASQGEAFRNLVNSGGGQSGGGAIHVAPNVHFNINAMDGASVQSALLANGKAVMRAMSRHIADGAHLGMRGLNSA
jgi:hypothetical protein